MHPAGKISSDFRPRTCACAQTAAPAAAEGLGGKAAGALPKADASPRHPARKCGPGLIQVKSAERQFA